MALGDSLTSGHGIGACHAYTATLQQWLDDSGLDFSIVNAGVSGDTSSGGARRADPLLRDADVRILIVALGANDGLRGVPVQQVRANLSSIIEMAQSRGIALLLCGMEALPIYGWEYSVAFHRMYRELATRYRVPLVPFLLADVIGNPELMQHDHVHPNGRGARLMARHIWPYLKPMAERVREAPALP